MRESLRQDHVPDHSASKPDKPTQQRIHVERMLARAEILMSTFPASIPGLSNSTSNGQNRPGYRTKTIATRITPEELAEIETAAERSGKTLAEWLRELALKSARERPADPMELLLSEVAATRYLLLNIFHATAQANGEGKHLLPESVLKIRETADSRKLGMARKLLADFLGNAETEGTDGAKK